MTYSATTWQTGDLITAVLLNNTESQYNTYYTESKIKYSTASTNTTLYSETASTFTTNTIETIMVGIWVPPNIDQSRLNLQADIKTATAGQLARLTIYSGSYNIISGSPGFNGARAHINNDTTSFVTKTTGFSVQGGEYLTLIMYCPTLGSFKSIYITGTSTASTPESFGKTFYWVTDLDGTAST